MSGEERTPRCGAGSSQARGVVARFADGSGACYQVDERHRDDRGEAAGRHNHIQVAWEGGVLGGYWPADAGRGRGRPRSPRLLRTAPGHRPVLAVGLRTAGLLPSGAGAVRVEAAADGAYRALLTDVDERTSELFADALDEVLAPLAAPRYLVSRVSLARPARRRDVYRLALGRLLHRPLPASESWHAVPAVLASSRTRAEAFAAAWAQHVGRTRLLNTQTPEGVGVLAACRGDDPFAATTQLRTVWR